MFQTFVFQGWGVPFWVTAGSAIMLILIYTLRGGIQTLVWTDLFQSGFLVLGVLLSIGALMIGLDWSPSDLVLNLSRGPETTVFNGDWRSPGFFWKQLISGAALAVVMTGLDQNNMQKTLSCRTLPEAQKNLWLFTPIMVLVTVAILVLGALLFRFAEMHGIPVPARTDELFPDRPRVSRHTGGGDLRARAHGGHVQQRRLGADLIDHQLLCRFSRI